VAVDRAHLRKDSQAVERQVLYWYSQGRRERGRSKRTWRRLEEWERPGKKLEPWAETGSARDASRKPYTPEGAQESKSSQVRSVWAASESFHGVF
jgi:hypothetical protein